jgi:hypothetical protein
MEIIERGIAGAAHIAWGRYRFKAPNHQRSAPNRFMAVIAVRIVT